MRKITGDAYDAFQAKKRFKKDNTEVKVFNNQLRWDGRWLNISKL